MSAILEQAPVKKPARQLHRRPLSTWSNGDDRIRVQINDPALARAFAKVKGVTRTGYSVMGPFTQIFLTQSSQDWVKDWMKEHNKRAKPEASAAPTSTTKTLAWVNRP